MERRSRISLVCLLLFAVLCLQPATGVAGERPTGNALQFGVGSGFEPSSFMEGTISYQRFLSTDLALRLGATIEVYSGTMEHAAQGTGEYEGSDSEAFHTWNDSVSLSCEWIVYRGSDVSLYFGGGPHTFYRSMEYGESRFRPYDDAIRWRDRTRKMSFGLGASGVIGVQWAPAEWCALHAEYRAIAAYINGTVIEYWDEVGGTYKNTRTTKRTSNGVEFDSKGVRAGVSIYF